MFIESYQINKKICSNLIEYFKENKDLHRTGIVGEGKIDTKIKDSVDLDCFSTKEDSRAADYYNELSKCINKYKEKYIYCDQQHRKWALIESPLIQKYKSNGGYRAWHFEKNGNQSFIFRHLVFMTYLNTVKNGGGTEFFYQNKKFKAKEGVTLIWPADWTFTHRGIISKKHEKYIITGWLSYC